MPLEPHDAVEVPAAASADIHLQEAGTPSRRSPDRLATMPDQAHIVLVPSGLNGVDPGAHELESRREARNEDIDASRGGAHWQGSKLWI